MLRRVGRALGTLVCQSTSDWPEIFSIDFEDHRFDAEGCRDLLTACLRALQASDAQHMTFFEKEAAALPILKELGFARVGEYHAYRMNVEEE